MRRNRIILGTLALLALLAVPAPAALAGGPLLSGYGGPGAGAQAIIGGTLLNGPKGGSGGGSGGSAGGSASVFLLRLSLLSLSLFLSPPPRVQAALQPVVVAGGRERAAPAVRRRHLPPGTAAGEVSSGGGVSAGSTGVHASRVAPGSLPGRLGERGSVVVHRRGPAGAWCWPPACWRSLRLPPCVCRVLVLIMNRRHGLERTSCARITTLMLFRMNGPRLTQQTTAPSLPLTRRPAARSATGPRSAHSGIFHGPLQLLLEEPGWNVLVPAIDFAMLLLAMVLALGGVHATLHVSAVAAPLLALPLLTLLTLYLRGLYRTRLRALMLDGLAPAVSAVSVAAMAVAAIGLLANGRIPDQSRWVAAWLLSLAALGVGRAVLALAQRWARSRRLVGTAGADRRRRHGWRAGGAPSGGPS